MSTGMGTSQRPARHYATGPVTRVLRLLSVLATLVITAWIVLSYAELPDTIATHFGLGGEADGWGGKASVLVLAAVMVVLSLALAALSTRPRALNYPTEIAERGAQAIYREGERMMVWTLLGLQVIYLDIARSVLRGDGGALITLGVGLLIGAVVVGIIRLVRAARTA
ncbi:DUF1648 domain-containing protein [Brachybacterium sacelli]|uniref:Membrane protein n=1 Tax=Brachybacterium sacelli TaxID=173364 RepID=A0ABS4X0C6_9MICO|nr:DUF1648 domain-containing protein [Brachybacterium sacelli]MBP2381683.1 putative membrane protein [Brachybacterium sacelli]